MTTISSIVASAREAYPQAVELKYVHPTLYVICVDPQFESMQDEARREAFTAKTGLKWEVLSEPSLLSVLSILLLTQKEREQNYGFLDSSSAGHHWLPLFDCQQAQAQTARDAELPHAVHFYGYKGGQARSTVLAMTARQLADDGYRVLTVDADTEAPSLDVIFDVAANSSSQTVLGLLSCDTVTPISAYVPQNSQGKIDLLACRPTSASYDMDFAAFALRTALDVSALEEGVRKLKPIIDTYDFVLFDHRSGLSISVLPIVAAYPGPVVICLRVDDQSRGADSLIDILLSQVRDIPGAYISFSLDPEDNREKMLTRHSERINKLLDKIGLAVERGSTDYSLPGQDLPPEDFGRYWVPWFHDRKFLEVRFPALADINEVNRSALLQLREVLGMTGKKGSSVASSHNSTRVRHALSPSGAEDEGVFIETPEIGRLFSANTSIAYIFGRKGTGKTRLLKELSTRGLGEPLIVAADAKGGGIPTGDAAFTDLAKTFANEPENLWWCILGAALDSHTTQGPSFTDKIAEWEKGAISGNRPIRASEIASIASKQSKRRVFLIDGIETAFRSSKLIEFVEALFKFLLTVQSDTKISDRIQIRLFLRTDLAKRAIQNVEQQTSGRRLDLTWNTQSIFNFVLSRIGQLEWFQQNFPEAVEKIAANEDALKAGLIQAADYEPLLLEIFPRHMRRNNLQTLTFLKTYFSDAAGDNENRAAFYPRLFDAFLGYVANPQTLQHGVAPPTSIEDGHIHQALVLAAHDAASRRFLDEVKQELTVLLDLATSPTENEQQVTQLLAAFDGLSTPFQLDECVKKLSELLGRVESSRIREALHRMKEIGMFEDRPGYAGWWRAGRLFKSALRMKYVR